MYITAGHKGQPEVVASLGRKGRRRKLRGKRGRGTLEGEKPPVLGLLQRSGEVVIHMLPNVQHVTIQPIITKTIAPGTMIYTDEYDIYDSLPKWGYQHKSVNHAAGEYARDEDGDGFHEVHVTTLEGFWSLPARLVASASWHFTRKVALVLRLFRVHPQCPQPRQCIASLAFGYLSSSKLLKSHIFFMRSNGVIADTK